MVKNRANKYAGGIQLSWPDDSSAHFSPSGNRTKSLCAFLALDSVCGEILPGESVMACTADGHRSRTSSLFTLGMDRPACADLVYSGESSHRSPPNKNHTIRNHQQHRSGQQRSGSRTGVHGAAG